MLGQNASQLSADIQVAGMENIKQIQLYFGISIWMIGSSVIYVGASDNKRDRYR